MTFIEKPASKAEQTVEATALSQSHGEVAKAFSGVAGAVGQLEAEAQSFSKFSADATDSRRSTVMRQYAAVMLAISELDCNARHVSTGVKLALTRAGLASSKAKRLWENSKTAIFGNSAIPTFRDYLTEGNRDGSEVVAWLEAKAITSESKLVAYCTPDMLDQLDRLVKRISDMDNDDLFRLRAALVPIFSAKLF